MLTVQESASRLGVSVGVIYGLCRAGRLRHLRIGVGRGVIRIPEDALASFLEECEACACATTKDEELRHIKPKDRA